MRAHPRAAPRLGPVAPTSRSRLSGSDQPRHHRSDPADLLLRQQEVGLVSDRARLASDVTALACSVTLVLISVSSLLPSMRRLPRSCRLPIDAWCASVRIGPVQAPRTT